MSISPNLGSCISFNSLEFIQVFCWGQVGWECLCHIPTCEIAVDQDDAKVLTALHLPKRVQIRCVYIVGTVVYVPVEWIFWDGDWERESLLEVLFWMVTGQQQRESETHFEVTALLSCESIPYYNSTLVIFYLISWFQPNFREEQSWLCRVSPYFLKILVRVEDSNLTSAPLKRKTEIWAQLYDCTPGDPRTREMSFMKELSKTLLPV